LRFDTLNIALSYRIRSIASDIFIIDNFGHKNTTSDQNKLEDLFAVEEVEATASIPLSCTNQEDRMIWRGSTNGIFSVKSAYHLAKEMEDRAMAGSSKGAPNNDV
jgi:hypothetical protein